jgi:hypothetical protein
LCLDIPCVLFPWLSDWRFFLYLSSLPFITHTHTHKHTHIQSETAFSHQYFSHF